MEIRRYIARLPFLASLQEPFSTTVLPQLCWTIPTPEVLLTSCANVVLVGARSTLGFGGLGYALYSASLLCYNHTKNAGFVIASGAILGVCAAFLWCAQGTVMMVAQTGQTSMGQEFVLIKYCY